MQTINFCRATRKRYARELRLAKRVIRAETVKKAKDEKLRLEREARVV